MSDPRDDLPARLASMTKPDVAADAVKSQLRLALVSARTSSSLGVVLVALPALFVAGVVLHYGLGLSVPGFSAAENVLSRVERASGALGAAVLLVVLPLGALVLNVLAVVHVEVDRVRRELLLSIRLRWLNLTIAGVALLIVALVFVHGVADR